MDMATPVSGLNLAMDFDQLSIDMMIPHHESIITLAHVAEPWIQDERLRAVIENIVASQVAEIAELRDYRARWYGSADPLPMDEQTMMQLMLGMTTQMDAMMSQMDEATLVAMFCAASEADLAFIDLVIPHHQSAIDVSELALQQATHVEIRAFA